MTGDEVQGTMGRRRRRSDSLPPSLAPKFSSRVREREVWVRGKFPALLLSRDLTIRQRRRQRERRESNWFTEISKTTSLHVHHAFWFISSPSLQDNNVKMHNFKFCRPREHMTTTFFCFFWTFIQSFWIELQKNLPTFDKLSKME